MPRKLHSIKPRASKPILVLFIFIFAALGSYLLVNSFAASNPNVYIAQNAAGAGTGMDCADAAPVTFFNTTANWGANSNQIGPGTTVHLCGTITTSLIAQGSGVSGNPVTILWESGSTISEPYCTDANSACFDTNGKSYLTLNGGTNGSIQATANGTGLANQHSPSNGIYMEGCNGCTVENLTIANIYQHMSSTDTSVGSTGGGNIGPFTFHNNHLHDFENWDTATNAFHHDGFYCYRDGGLSSPPHYQGVYIYDNRWDSSSPSTGPNFTSPVSLGGNQNNNSCADSTSPFYIFNNVVDSSNYQDQTQMELGSGEPIVYNNTMMGGTAGGGTAGFNTGDSTAGNVFQNNIISGDNTMMEMIPKAGAAAQQFATGSPNYNVYAQPGGGTGIAFNCGTYTSNNFISFSNFASWKSCIAGDSNSLAATSALLNADGSLQSGSPAIGAGANLTSTCSGQPNPGLGALCSDINGTARPATGPWDVGAYQFSSTPQPVIGDLNADGHVNIFDLSIFLSHWQQTGAGLPEDLNSDGIVNIFDLSILLSHYGA